ncbi:xylose isomerase-like protein [Diaporthe sp. PMI_573]|nr:xylose isomerase-like protein [Diaporthaceae sp. PMI_573]
MMLQPFVNFEGWNDGNDEGKSQREDAFERARGWIRIMQELGTDMLQVGSTDSSNIITDKHRLAADLAQLADMLSTHNMRLAYENWCWATAAPTWSDVYNIVVLADRPNIGLCLDTFQTAGGEWGDPTTATGYLEGLSQSELRESYLTSLRKLASVIPAEKIYLLQVSDAYKPPQPLNAKPDQQGMRPRARWSAVFRPMPGEERGYLPVVEMARAVRDTGFRGWHSIEIFDGGPSGRGRECGELDEEARQIMELARRFDEEVENYQKIGKQK